ncbi:MAG: DNA repair protein RecN [Capnocytophaga sp.]|uniref:DNA repair protein RecN n=1 Tax=Capnocytophaga sp. oral taxon 863 TaxID=1227265 RepID=UPI0003970792|nr:DNA repair protein RecN [Capnocytophaga sp. oral taxon 863]ERI62206.1 DNA repair protein RecN [Capnocytophaga sp. oral taxon 863 str. F0517]RKW19141.1 MAG: DNA repair protein RecN [Capnocytophaga sp.]
MLQSLAIKNFALIEDMKVPFSKGFTIITGETGSGKSILLDALALVLGRRADLSALRNKEEKCVVEAEFAIENYALADFFHQEELDYEPLTIIRREILPSGKSRAFVNDSPVTLDVLSRLSKALIDIHSQHDTQQLSEEDFQFFLIDALAENTPLLQEYQAALKVYKQQSKKLQELKDFQENTQKEHDYNTFVLGELQEIDLEEGMQEELEAFYTQASNSETIRDNLTEAANLLAEEEQGIMTQVRELSSLFSSLSSYSPQYNELYERIDAVFIELDDLSREVYDLAENVEFDPKKLARVQKKLQKIYDLQKKHKVATVAELIAIEEALEAKVAQMENIEGDIEIAQKEADLALQTLSALAQKLHKAREKVIPTLTKSLQTSLKDLGMPNAQFQISLSPTDHYQAKGNDTLSFLFSANKGGNFGLLKKTASGGELSRIMLTIKSLLATKIALPTIIFDEIDTGVSGEIAHKMGEIMKQMSQSRQVFAISHLPQVASKGDAHIKIYKTDIEGRTTTQFQALSQEQRIEEIAQMLGGKDITDSARAHAKELLKSE